MDAHIRGGFVKDENAGVLQQCACHAQQLPLTGAQVRAALHQLSVKTALMDMGYRHFGIISKGVNRTSMSALLGPKL